MAVGKRRGSGEVWGMCGIFAFKNVLLCSILALGTCVASANESIEDKTRVLIFSRMNDHQTDAFYDLLEKTNPEIDGSFRPAHLNETDVVIYLLNSWDEAADAPGARELSREFERVYTVQSPAVSHSFIANYSDGSSLVFIFYSAVDANYPALKCYALDAAIEASREPGEKFENNALVDCAQ